MERVKKKSNRGFSLVELAVVIALITVLATIGISTWTRYIDNSNLREAARDIESDIKFMQRNARANAFTANDIYFDIAPTVDYEYKIIFNRTDNEYTLAARNTTKNSLLFTRTKKLSAFGTSEITFESLPNAGTTYDLFFSQRGILSPTGNSRTFVIKNRRNSIARIVYELTGKVHVETRTQ